jgi:hypothetical protein
MQTKHAQGKKLTLESSDTPTLTTTNPLPQDTPKKIGETQSVFLEWLAEVPVEDRLRNKIKAGQKPTFIESLILLGHDVGRVMKAVEKDDEKLFEETFIAFLKELKNLLKNLVKSFGKFLFNVLCNLMATAMVIAFFGLIAYVVWKTYFHGQPTLQAMAYLLELFAKLANIS